MAVPYRRSFARLSSERTPTEICRTSGSRGHRMVAAAVVTVLATVPFAFGGCEQPPTATADSGAETPSRRTEAVLVNAAPTGPVDAIVRDALVRARTDNRRVVVYAGATWCEPCQAFHRALESGELAGRFLNVDFLAFDVDRDRDRLLAAGYRWTYIPLFALPGTDGFFSGAPVVQGGIKGQDVLPSLEARLEKMLSP